MKTQMASLRETFRRDVRHDPDYRHWVLVDLYGHQTQDEKDEERTKWSNEVGFNSIDDQVLTRLAEQYLGGKKLTNAEEAELCKRLPKYWRQFLVVLLRKPRKSLQKKATVGTTRKAA